MKHRNMNVRAGVGLSQRPELQIRRTQNIIFNFAEDVDVFIRYEKRLEITIKN